MNNDNCIILTFLFTLHLRFYICSACCLFFSIYSFSLSLFIFSKIYKNQTNLYNFNFMNFFFIFCNCLIYLRWLLTKINFSAIWKNVYSFTTWTISLFLTILVLLFFMILERNDFKKKIKYNFDSKITRKVQNIYEKVSSDLNLYFSTKFFLALFNGVVATIIMSLFWLDFALTFWLIVFIMDFIPIVWALIALWLPFLYSLVVFDSIWSSFLMLFSMYVPQIVTGNFVEPKIMWDILNISYIVFVLALLFWTQFWWIIWAFLATPIMVTINIILSKFEATKFISVLLSKDWWK